MVCRNCNRVIPDGNTYCMYCGAPTVEDLPATIPVGAPRPEPAIEDIPAMPYGGTVPLMEEPPMVFPEEAAGNVPVEPVMATAPVDYAIPTPPAQNPVVNVTPAAPGGLQAIMELGKKFWLPILAVALVIIVVMGISLGSLKGKLAEAEEALSSSEKSYEDKLNELEGTVGEQKQTIADQKEQIEDLQMDADAYHEMYRAMNDYPVGKGAHHFQASERLVVVKNGNTNAKFTLTANWATATDVEDIVVEYTSDCAMISFDRETWYTDTTLTVIPREPGFTVATFHNKLDSEVFSVLILVLE